MKKTSTKRSRKPVDDMQTEYRFDYKKARPNRFAGQTDKRNVVVLLDKDVSKVFSTPESVNSALRALISAIPKPAKTRKSA